MFVLKVSCLLITLKSCCILIQAATGIKKFEPLNIASHENVTFMEGDIAILPCPFKTMGYLKVVWLSPNLNTISFQGRLFTNDMRVSVVNPANDTWNLHINNISSKDTGYYKCLLNTDPMQTKKMYLDVKSVAAEKKKIQPMIVPTIYHVTAKKGGNAILPCSLKNWTKGNIKVERMSSDKISKSISYLRIPEDEYVLVKSSDNGDWNLRINNVSSRDTGYYRCSLRNNPEKKMMVYLHVKGPHDKSTGEGHRKKKYRLGTYCVRHWRRPTLRTSRPTLRTTRLELSRTGKVDQTTRRTWTLDPKLDLAALRASFKRIKEEPKYLFRCSP